MRPPSGNRVTQGQHGTSKAIDYSASPDPTVYAPEDGVIDSYQQRGSGVNDAGNALRLRGTTGLHQFAHLERSLVAVGQRVIKGQPIAVMGHTGYTIPAGAAGRHLHYWVQTPSGFVYPPQLYREAFNQPQANKPQGDEMIANADQAQKIYRILRPNGGASQDEINSTAGRRTFAEFINSAQNEVNARDAQLREQIAQLNQLNQNLATSQSREQAATKRANELTQTIQELKNQLTEARERPPEVVVKEVEKIVEKCDVPATQPVPTAPWWIKLLAKFVKSKPSADSPQPEA